MPGQEIVCTECGNREPMPECFKELKQRDLDYVLDGYLCQKSLEIVKTYANAVLYKWGHIKQYAGGRI